MVGQPDDRSDYFQTSQEGANEMLTVQEAKCHISHRCAKLVLAYICLIAFSALVNLQVKKGLFRCSLRCELFNFDKICLLALVASIFWRQYFIFTAQFYFV